MPEPARSPRVLALVGDESGPTLWRIYLPFTELLRNRGVTAHWKYYADPELNDPSFLIKLPFNFDAIILPRLSWRFRWDTDFYVTRMHNTGMAVILEIDDDVFTPSIVDRIAAVFEKARARGPEQLERERKNRIWLLSAVDGVTVSSRRLAMVVRQYTDTPVQVVPNAIDTRWFRSRLRGYRREIPPLTIGWAGGARYAEDLEPVAAAWSRVARRFPDVTFVVQGHMADVLIDAVPADRVRRLPWLPLELYPRALPNIDIGCCSVAAKLFNTAKTPIKVWEYTMAGAASVCSPTLYGPVVTDGEDALVAETADEWEAALGSLVENSDLRRRLWRAQRRRIAKDHSLDANWWRWPNAWAAILDAFRATGPRPGLALVR